MQYLMLTFVVELTLQKLLKVKPLAKVWNVLRGPTIIQIINSNPQEHTEV